MLRNTFAYLHKNVSHFTLIMQLDWVKRQGKEGLYSKTSCIRGKKLQIACTKVVEAAMSEHQHAVGSYMFVTSREPSSVHRARALSLLQHRDQ